MKRKLIVFLTSIMLIMVFFIGCANKESENIKKDEPVKKSEASITKDMAGREIKLPEKIERVYATNPAGTIIVYTLVPDKLTGWNVKLAEEEKKFMPEKYRNLPVVGGWYGKDTTGNAETILKAKPDIIIHVASINDKEKSTADRIQQQLNVPVIMADTSLLNSDKTYEFLGKILKEEEKAKKLGDYCKKTINDVKDKVSKIGQDKRVKVYYAEGLNGLQTEPKGSVRNEVLDIAGGENVIKSATNKSSYGNSKISLEQLIALNPEVIITRASINDGKINSAYDNIIKNKDWQSIKAIKDKRVYQIPQVPFNWFDRPPSVNRVIGIKWIYGLLYENSAMNIGKEVKEFYKEFYHYELTDKEVEEILNKAK
ncbi:iron complex transport system substrate-binding protein [Clostridium tetanomorphum]|uniref:ABC transporter substrate-binding protein n=1 Tax=Clostridium tetanomorphum TaxID=1553 RepID=UPI00044EC212|nr:ABC transporter substrate-binding protein [Clostridium tetanomorphum]KAJ48809.1 periplasmic binding protein [Clostridium tetanomorphum DSM 665]KAJ52066.1 periplasmic binding protein [Clostridium tetanomorphum DSM 665]MBP1862986.1 iron complex transport system substrate-binding protein [Clostridium tetanomorphum]NRS82815.1 iron complex transport system substrate-binding protein [Clostridium tetanomorphum]SQC00064.1 ABC transporter substrate-binding protein [Clostridium tetanomorphum]